jgi:hypothetical protein
VPGPGAQLPARSAARADGRRLLRGAGRRRARALHTGRLPGGQYTALLIDEAHDFEDAWLRIASRMVSPATNSLLVLYDDAQSIYQHKRRKFNFASVGIEARGRTSILKPELPQHRRGAGTGRALRAPACCRATARRATTTICPWCSRPAPAAAARCRC